MNDVSPVHPGDLAEGSWRLLTGVGLASFLGCLDFTIVNTAIPTIQSGLEAALTQSQWIVTAFLLALCAFMVVTGRLADIYGRRRTLYVGMAAFGLFSLCAGTALSIYWLAAFRLGQGIACAAIYTAAAAIVSDAYPETQRGRALGVLFGINGIGLALGPFFGGLLTSTWGWRSVFLINVPVILLSFAICRSVVRESHGEPAWGMDWKGVTLLVVGITSLLLLINNGNAWGWRSNIATTTLVCALVSLSMFVWFEFHTPHPLLDIRAVMNQAFLSAGLSTFSLAFFYCAAFFFMPLYLHGVQHLDPLLVGLMLLPATVTMAASSPLVGRLTDSFGPMPLLLVGFLFLGLSAALQTRPTAISVSVEVIAYCAMGVGWACVLGPSTVAALGSAPDTRAGAVTGASWTIHNLGGAIGIATATLVFELASGGWTESTLAGVSAGATAFRSLGEHGQADASFLEGYAGVMWLLLCIALMTEAGLLCAFLYRRRRKAKRPSE